MVRCFFCSREVEPGRGIIFITLEGKALHFCSSKCKKHFKLGRNKKQKWLNKKQKEK